MFFEPKNITALYSRGSDEGPIEDGKVVHSPYYVVVDAFSEPHAPKYPQTLIPQFDGPDITVGEMISRTIEDTFHTAPSQEKLENILCRADKKTWNTKLKHMLPEIARLAGATFAAAKIDEQQVEIICAGDAFALVQQRNGNIFFSKNQVLLHDRRMHRFISGIMEKVAKERGIKLEQTDGTALKSIRAEMWNRFCPILREARGEAINNPDVSQGYGALNGELARPRLWEETSYLTKDIKCIFLFTDGFIHWSLLGRMKHTTLAKFILEMYQTDGVDGILRMTRALERATATSHISYAEATVIALDL